MYSSIKMMENPGRLLNILKKILISKASRLINRSNKQNTQGKESAVKSEKIKACSWKWRICLQIALRRTYVDFSVE